MSKTDPLYLAKTKPTECAPHINVNVCSTQHNIQIMRDWLDANTKNPEEIIKLAKEKTHCDSESCVIKKVPGLDKSELDSRFIPEGPRDSTTWLSNVDIDSVLDMYTKKFPKFKHINFHMSDFEKLNHELATIDWLDISKNYTSLGCVINTAPNGTGGEHWTAFYVDFVGHTVEYFDSANAYHIPQLKQFTTKVAIELTEKTKTKYNDIFLTDIKHQEKNSECGVYSLYYILSRLTGVPYTAFRSKRVADEDMVRFRKFIFRK